MTTPSTGFDITKEKAAAQSEDEGTVVHIEGLDGKPMYHGKDESDPVTITIAGAYSRTARKVDDQIRKRPFKAGRKLTMEPFYDDQIEKLAACTLAWSGFFSDGKPFECNRANAAALYDACHWVLDQVVEAHNDHARFLDRSSA